MAALVAMLLLLLAVPTRADDPITELMSPIVSYQFPDDLGSMALTNGGLLSPIVSYVYCEWPGDDVLGLISSPWVSYLFPGYDGPPTTIVIFAHPQNVAAPLGARVQLAVGAVGTPPLRYQWLRNGAAIPGATDAVLLIPSAATADNGRYAVRVSDASGGPSALSREAQVAVAGPGADEVEPVSDEFDLPPANGRDRIIVVTHGWQPGITAPTVSPPWLTSLTQSLRSRLSPEYQVEPANWLREAWALTPDVARDRALIRGKALGRTLRERGYTHVHLIGHSAGAALVDAAARELDLQQPRPIVHCTFLDPFTGVGREWSTTLGAAADWADNYFVRDTTDVAGSHTSGPLTHAWNVDVAGADPSAVFVNAYNSNGQATAGSTPVVRASQSHDSPCEFYIRTVAGAVDACAGRAGFPFSVAGGFWDTKPQRGNDPPLALCAAGAERPGPPPLPRVNYSLNLNAGVFGTSPQGVSGLGGTGFNFFSPPSPNPRPRQPKDGWPEAGVPAWYALVVEVTNRLNVAVFEAAFAGTNAGRGVLSVFWDTNLIGFVDERMAEPGLRGYEFPLPEMVTAGLGTLSFRLDSFGGVASAVTVTNVALGFRGLAEPIRLTLLPGAGAGSWTLRLEAPAGYDYLLLGSDDLVEWEPEALLLNTAGTVECPVPAPSGAGRKFYRAVWR